MPDDVVVGILYPGHAAEDDYPLAQELLGPGVRLPVVHTEMPEDAHRVDALLEIGHDNRLAAGAEELSPHGPQAVVWACTSGSFVFGWGGAQAQAAALAKAAGVPAASTSIGFIHAARALGVRTVAVAATYPADVTERFGEYLAADGVQVRSAGAAGIYTAAEVGALDRSAVVDLALAHDHPEAEAVLIPDTALHTVEAVPTLERRLGKPVLTANQVSVWIGLRLAGHPARVDRLGALFAEGADQGEAAR